MSAVRLSPGRAGTALPAPRVSRRAASEHPTCGRRMPAGCTRSARRAPAPVGSIESGRRASRQAGIALLEALIAIVILGIGLLGMIGLQGRAYAALSDASMRAEATMAGEKLLGVMNTDIANLASYNLVEGAAPNATLAPWVQETQRAIPGARLSVRVQAQAQQSQVDIGIRWQRKAAGEQNRHVVTAYIAN